MSQYRRQPVAAPPAEVVATLRGALQERGFTEYAVVDHGHDMAAAGAPAHPAWTLIFGNPTAGSKLLDEDLAAAVDIPLRLAVIGAEGGGSEIIARDMRTLLPDHLRLADAYNEAVGLLATSAG